MDNGKSAISTKDLIRIYPANRRKFARLMYSQVTGTGKVTLLSCISSSSVHCCIQCRKRSRTHCFANPNLIRIPKRYQCSFLTNSSCLYDRYHPRSNKRSASPIPTNSLRRSRRIWVDEQESLFFCSPLHQLNILEMSMHSREELLKEG